MNLILSELSAIFIRVAPSDSIIVVTARSTYLLILVFLFRANKILLANVVTSFSIVRRIFSGYYPEHTCLRFSPSSFSWKNRRL